MLIAEFTKQVSNDGISLVIEGALLPGEPIAEITNINSGPALVLLWPDEAIVLMGLDAETVLMLALSKARIYETDTRRKLIPQPTLHEGYKGYS